MAEPINLPRLDPPIDYNDINPQIVRWWSDIVDLVNQAFTQIEGFENNIVAAQSSNIGGGGAGPIIVSVPGLTSSSIVTANIISSSNPVTIISIVPGTNQFSITFSADPGASAIISYIVFFVSE